MRQERPPRLRAAVRRELVARICAHVEDDCRSVARVIPPAGGRDAAAELVRRGYRACARHAHPDVGRTHGAMLLLAERKDGLVRVTGEAL